MATLFVESQLLDQEGLNVALGSEKIVTIFDNSAIAVTNKGTLIDLNTMETSSELKKIMIYEIRHASAIKV